MSTLICAAGSASGTSVETASRTARPISLSDPVVDVEECGRPFTPAIVSPVKPGKWLAYYELFRDGMSVEAIAEAPPALKTGKRPRPVQPSCVVLNLLTALLAGKPLDLSRLRAHAPTLLMWRLLCNNTRALHLDLEHMTKDEYERLMRRCGMHPHAHRTLYKFWKTLVLAGWSPEERVHAGTPQMQK